MLADSRHADGHAVVRATRNRGSVLDMSQPDPRPRLRHVRRSDLSPETAQTSGMLRSAAVSGSTVGAQVLWMGETRIAPGMVSANHHHGDSETAIYVVSGNPVFVFLDDSGEIPCESRLATQPGDYVFVPAWVPHREENPDPDHEALVVLARSTQEAIVVNLPGLAGDT
jgi:uncharacterized RmlC-like cupin family protein